jgi:hypothetical protein
VGTQPEVMRQEIAETRQEISSDLEALNDKMNPQLVYERKKESAKGRMSQAKEKVMGAKEEASGAAHSAEQTAQQKTQGQPLLAGAVAFGAGYLLSALFPSTKAEQQAGGGVKEKAQQHKGELKQEASRTLGSMVRSPSAGSRTQAGLKDASPPSPMTRSSTSSA